jgi:predicted ATPase
LPHFGSIRAAEEARHVLARIYGWFTQGFETQDLKEAQALFEQLR